MPFPSPRPRSPLTHASAVAAAFQQTRPRLPAPRALPLTDASPGSPQRPVTSSAPGPGAQTLSHLGPRLPSRLPQERGCHATATPVPSRRAHPGAGGASNSSQSKSRAPRPAPATWRHWARAPRVASQEEASVGSQVNCPSSVPVSIRSRCPRPTPEPLFQRSSFRPGQGELGSSATSGSSCFKPRSCGFSLPWEESQLPLTRMRLPAGFQQPCSKSAREISYRWSYTQARCATVGSRAFIFSPLSAEKKGRWWTTVAGWPGRDGPMRRDRHQVDVVSPLHTGRRTSSTLVVSFRGLRNDSSGRGSRSGPAVGLSFLLLLLSTHSSDLREWMGGGWQRGFTGRRFERSQGAALQPWQIVSEEAVGHARPLRHISIRAE